MRGGEVFAVAFLIGYMLGGVYVFCLYDSYWPNRIVDHNCGYYEAETGEFKFGRPEK